MKIFDKATEVYRDLLEFNERGNLTLEDIFSSKDSSIINDIKSINDNSRLVSSTISTYYKDLIGIETFYLDSSRVRIRASKEQLKKRKGKQHEIIQEILREREDSDFELNGINKLIFENEIDKLFESYSRLKYLDDNEHKLLGMKAQSFLISYFSSFERFTFKALKLSGEMNFRVKKEIKEKFKERTKKSGNEEFIEILASGNMTESFHKAERNILNFLKKAFKIDGHRYKISDIIKQIYDEHIILRQLRNMIVHRSNIFDNDFITELREIIRPLKKEKMKKEEYNIEKDRWIFTLMENLNLDITLLENPEEHTHNNDNSLDLFVGKPLMLSPKLLLRSYLILYSMMLLFSLRIPGLTNKEKSKKKKSEWKKFNENISSIISEFIHSNLVLYDKTKIPDVIGMLKTFLKIFDVDEVKEIFTPGDNFYNHSALVYHEVYLGNKLKAIMETKELAFELELLNKIYSKEETKSSISKMEKNIRKNNKDKYKLINIQAASYKKKYLDSYKKIKSKTIKNILHNYFKADIPSVIESAILESEKTIDVLPKAFEDNFEIRHLTDKHIVKKFIYDYREIQRKISSINIISELINKKAP